jgi:flagellar biosynthesis protein FlhF
MRIKTFYTKTMSEALREVKEHLGSEALILSTKEIPCRSGAWGRSSGFEVVAASDNAENVDTYSSSREIAAIGEKRLLRPAEPIEETAVAYTPSGLASQALLKAKKEVKKATKSKPSPASEAALEAEPDDGLPFKGRAPVVLYQDLVNCGVDEALARNLIAKALDSLSAGQRRSRPALMRAAAHAALSLVAPDSNSSGMPAKKVVAFVGPTGVGKTTSIAKLAAHLALRKKKRVLLMTLDGYRIGAIEQLRIYAGLMGIPFRFVDQVSELSRAIDENSQRDYILIDTAGRGPKDLNAMSSLASFLKDSQRIERHLVLSATMKQSDMRKIMDQFEICGPDHLLFTKLDETETPGPILNELVRTRKSFSYYTDGQRVPDDLHAFPRERIIEILINRNENALKE